MCNEKQNTVSIAKEMTAVKKKAKTTLRKEGRYSPLYDMQVEIVSMLVTKIRQLIKEMESPDYQSIELETSREGYDRKKINPCESLLQDYTALALRALKGLGMSTESKDRKTDNDSFKDFLDELKEG